MFGVCAVVSEKWSEKWSDRVRDQSPSSKQADDLHHTTLQGHASPLHIGITTFSPNS